LYQASRRSSPLAVRRYDDRRSGGVSTSHFHTIIIVFNDDRQAHFDCVPPKYTVIDGARSKWCLLLLLNGIVGILDFESFNLAARRKFNQQNVLYECIKAELEETGFDESQQDGYVGDIRAVLDSCWQDMKSLRNFLEKNAPYKSKDKYLAILDLLLGHKVFLSRGSDVGKCINAAIVKILAPTNRKSNRRAAVAPAVPVVRSKRVLAAKTEPISKPTEDEEDMPVMKRPRRGSPKKPAVPVACAEDSAHTPRTHRRKAAVTPKAEHASVNTPPARPPRAAFKRRVLSRQEPPTSVPARACTPSEAAVSVEESHGDNFDQHELFSDPNGIDPNAQEWELLEPGPERNQSPRHYIQGGKVRLLSVGQRVVLDKRASPFALSERVADATTEYHLAPRGLCPFPSAEDLGTAAECMAPFPVQDDANDATADDDDAADVGLPLDMGPF
jgi:hypothetical protein